MSTKPASVRILEEFDVTDPQGNSRKVYHYSRLEFPALGDERERVSESWYENGVRLPVTRISETEFKEESTGDTLTLKN